MRKVQTLLTLLLVCFIVMGCGNTATERGDAERDSLEQANQFLLSSIGLIASTLDSIAAQENLLMVFNGDGKEVMVTDKRKIIRQRLDALSNLLQSQKHQMAELNAQLEDRGEEMSGLKSLLNQVNKQLAQKTAEVERLGQSLQESKKKIAVLKNDVETLNMQNTSQEEMLNEQQEALAAQDKVINEGYVLVATTQELQAAGIITSGGFLKKKKVDLSAITQDRFQTVDIREFTSLPINKRRVKLLTPAPKESYKLSPDGDGWVFTITDAASFWSVSNYMVVKAD